MRRVQNSRLFRKMLPRKRLGRSLLWTIGMAIVIVWLIQYLNKIAATG